MALERAGRDDLFDPLRGETIVFAHPFSERAIGARALQLEHMASRGGAWSGRGHVQVFWPGRAQRGKSVPFVDQAHEAGLTGAIDYFFENHGPPAPRREEEAFIPTDEPIDRVGFVMAVRAIHRMQDHGDNLST